MRPAIWPILGLLTVVLFAGCLQNSGGSDDPPTGGTWSAESEYGVKPYPVQLHERITPGAEKEWTFEVRNEAPGANPVTYDAACAGPFRVTLLGPDSRAHSPEPPRMDCQATDMQTLDAGDVLAFRWTWDGRIYDDGAAATPPKGLYRIQVGFEGYHDGNREHETDGALGWATVYVDGR